jgi:translation initiation factor IF-3
MEILGRVKVINPEQQVSATFKKREIVVTTDEQYPQHIIMDFVQDKCEALNAVNVGDNVKVSINVRGREWVSPQGETKYFNTLQGWRIEKIQAESPQGTVAPMPTAQPFEPASNFNEEEHDDLPF